MTKKEDKILDKYNVSEYRKVKPTEQQVKEARKHNKKYNKLAEKRKNEV